MPANQYLPIATGVGANALTAAQWAALGQLLAQGFQSGVVPSVQFNTFLRQLSVPVSALAQFTADYQPADVLDDGSVTNFETKLKAALQSFVGASLGTLHTLQNTQQFKTSNRVSLSASAANQKVTFWSPGNYVKKSATSLLSIQAFLVLFTPAQGGNGAIRGFDVYDLSIGGTIVTFAAANGYQQGTGTPAGGISITSSPVTQIAGLGAGSYAVNLAGYTYSNTTWMVLFNPTGSDVSGYPPSISSSLIISEIEP